ncbi:MAG TPA: 50S ribosomal protein L15 [Candidatus Limnocylindrales bacterium]|nr:50S ribosomal protein L15 [Candidatus Limnocylindrales bacterium]
MKLHDLRPAAGSRKARTRVGRGIAAGQGKTAGRGTKGQRARAGASIPAWFEGGQTPIHIRVPKLRGFKNRFKIEYQPVNVGVISAYAEAGRFGVEGHAKEDVITVNAETLASAGLISSAEKPIKVLGQGEISQKVFVAADKFSTSARAKIEAAGGFVQVLAPEKAEKTSKAERTAAADRRRRGDEPAGSADAGGSRDAPESEGSATSTLSSGQAAADLGGDESPESGGSTASEIASEPEAAAKPAKRAAKKDTAGS